MVKRIETIDDFCGEGGLATAGNARDTDQDALVGGGFVEFPCKGSWG